MDKNRLFVCDIWKSKIHREFHNYNDYVSDINRKKDDIFVYYSVCQKKDVNCNTQIKNDDRKVIARFVTFAIIFEKHTERVYHRHQPQEEYMGYPILVTFDLNISVTIKEIRDRIWELIKAFIPNFNINDYNKNNKNNKVDIEKPFKMEARYQFNSVTELTASDKTFDLSPRNMRFVIHFNDPTKYHNDGYYYSTRVRHVSAPEKIGRSGWVEANEYKSTLSIDLEECIDTDASSRAGRLSQHNLWYCKKCKYFRCIENKIFSWNSPDLLIIHLDRFNDGKAQTDCKIDMLINFKIDQGLLVPNDNEDIGLYELYAIKNYDKTSGFALEVCIWKISNDTHNA